MRKFTTHVWDECPVYTHNDEQIRFNRELKLWEFVDAYGRVKARNESRHDLAFQCAAILIREI